MDESSPCVYKATVRSPLVCDLIGKGDSEASAVKEKAGQVKDNKGGALGFFCEVPKRKNGWKDMLGLGEKVRDEFKK